MIQDLSWVTDLPILKFHLKLKKRLCNSLNILKFNHIRSIKHASGSFPATLNFLHFQWAMKSPCPTPSFVFRPGHRVSLYIAGFECPDQTCLKCI